MVRRRSSSEPTVIPVTWQAHVNIRLTEHGRGGGDITEGPLFYYGFLLRNITEYYGYYGLFIPVIPVEYFIDKHKGKNQNWE